MSQSSEWTNMKQALKDIVVPKLRSCGFRGSFPHFRRKNGSRIDLVSFLSHSQSGGAFEVGASIVYENAELLEETNLFHPGEPVPSGQLNWAHGRIRNSLPGIHAGTFFYVDTYRRALDLPDIPGEHYHYTSITPKHEKYLKEHLAANHYELILKAGEDIYRKNASEVLRQLDGLLQWFDEMKTYGDLLQWKHTKDKERAVQMRAHKTGLQQEP